MDILEFKKRILPLNGKVYHYAYLLLKNKAEAEDAVQEVYLKLWKIRHSLEQYNSLEAFTLKVTRNWCLDRIKSKKPVYIETYNSWYDKKDDEADPLRMLENNDHLDLLFGILDKLPDQQKQIIQLRDIENREFEEIADIMDMKINAVRVSLSRARNKIREEMTKFQYK
jgi:RNA polymerase sigma-70 factor (ECF subfamily)